ncbi:MAG TPA: hypothetical protein VFS40_01860, partial [Gemmatimonadales bacterium]|nr:hypothetical protein [Gemmatimonadales bacterium]
PERVALVDVGAAAVAATIVHDSVWRLSVTDSLLRTADSLGVGTPLGVLRARAGWRALRGEGNLVVQLPGHCGLSFRLRPSPAAARAADADAAVRRLPANTPVEEVFVVGCR